MRVLALDPGERVGWARADIAEDGTWTDLRHGITPLKDMALTLHSRCDTYDVIVCEEFRLSAMGAKHLIGSTFPTVQFIGMVRMCCWPSGTELVMQSTSTKSTADKTMKALRPELYDLVTKPVAHDDGHDQDALRHLWFYTWKNYGIRKEHV